MTPKSISRLMIFRRCSSAETMASARAMTAVNYHHSFGFSLSFGVTMSIRHQFDGAGDCFPRLRGALQQIIADHQVIHLGVHETAVGVVGRADDRLAAHVERRV